MKGWLARAAASTARHGRARSGSARARWSPYADPWIPVPGFRRALSPALARFPAPWPSPSPRRATRERSGARASGRAARHCGGPCCSPATGTGGRPSRWPPSWASRSPSSGASSTALAPPSATSWPAGASREGSDGVADAPAHHGAAACSRCRPAWRCRASCSGCRSRSCSCPRSASTPPSIGVMAAAYAAVVPLLEVPSGHPRRPVEPARRADRWPASRSPPSALLGGLSHRRDHLRGRRAGARRLLRAATPAPSTASSTTPCWRRPAAATTYERRIGRVRVVESGRAGRQRAARRLAGRLDLGPA